MGYSVVFKPSAQRALDELPKVERVRMIAALERLSENPRRSGVVKLEAAYDLYRIRVGSLRAVFTIEDERLVVLVLKIGHRREVYR